MQIIIRKDKEKGFAFKKIAKDPNIVYDENQYKALVKFTEDPRVVVRKSSINYRGLQNQADDIGEFDSDSLDLEPIRKDRDIRTLVDIR